MEYQYVVPRRKLGWLGIIAAGAILTGCSWFAGSEPATVDFNTLTNGTRYYVGDSFTLAGVQVVVLPFEWANGTTTTAGFATVTDQLNAGGSGLDINLNNVCLGFDTGETASVVSLKFGEYGGNINVQANDDFVNQADFYGMILPNIALDIQDLGSSLGTIEATGVFVGEPFVLDTTAGEFTWVIGGQELFIDDVVFGF